MKEGWEVKKLGDVCEFQNGFAFKSKSFKKEGVPVVRITNIKDEKLDLSKIVYIDPKDYNKDFEGHSVNGWESFYNFVKVNKKQLQHLTDWYNNEKG